MNVYNQLLVAGMLAMCSLSYAQSEPAGKSQSQTAVPAASIADATRGMQKFEGFFNFYHDEKSGKILLEIDKFGTEFLYFTSLQDGAGPNAERGRASANVVKFTKVGPKVFLEMPNLGYRAVTGTADEVKAVENAFPKSVIWGGVPVAAEGGRALVDLTSFIVRDAQSIAGALGSSAAGSGTYRVDESRSAVYMPNTKNFPKNTEFEAVLTFTSSSVPGRRRGGIAPDPSAITVKEHQSFVELPPPGYKQRKYDARSGFFVFNYVDFSAPMSEPLVKRFIRRHRLAKKNPNAAVSEPVEPIIYYIDRGAPEPIKTALIEGGNFWKEAFEAAGYENAFEVKELPEGVDPMDIRYNIVNWINRAGTTRAFSSGASYIDPRTGEIIKGVVTLGSDRHRQDYLIAEGLLQPYEDGKPVPSTMEEIALARIRQLSAHEIGHTLGLMHNFAASVKDRGSVMDYPFPRMTLKDDGTLDFSDAYAVGAGGWDKRAVIWGYSDFPEGTDEDAELGRIMDETIEMGYQYIPDIGGYAHPASHQWDDGEDPIDQLGFLMKVRRITLDKFSEKAIAEGAPMTTLQEVLVPIYLLHRYQIEAVAKSIGGLYFTHALKNDGQLPTRMVDPAQQWKAFDALMATITPEALALPDELISKIPPRPTGYPRTVELFSSHTGPTFDPLSAAEAAASETISSLLNPERAARLIEYSSRDSRQPGFLDVADRLIEKTWKAPLPEGYEGALQSVVNNLVLKHLIELAANTQASELVRGQALLELDGLKSWMTSGLSSAQPRQKAAFLFALSQMDAFDKDPDKFQPAPAEEMPPGAPIGMPDMDFGHDKLIF